MQPVENKSTFWIIIGVIQMLCCNQISGIITIIFAALASSDYTHGDIPNYLTRIRCAKIATIAGIVIGIVIWLLAVLIYGATIMAFILNS